MATAFRFEACGICGVKARLIFSPNCPHLRPQFDDGPDGALQSVLPGAERVSQADIAKRRALAPLKPKRAQESPGGLWDYEGEQLDLVEMFQDQPEDGL